MRMASTSKSCSILFSIQSQYGRFLFFFRFLGINYRIWSIWLRSGFKAGHFALMAARESCQTREKCSWRLTKNRWKDQGFLWLYPQHGARKKKKGGKETGMSSFTGRFSIIALLRHLYLRSGSDLTDITSKCYQRQGTQIKRSELVKKLLHDIRKKWKPPLGAEF